MSCTVIIVGKCVTNAGKWNLGGHLPVGKSFAKKILEHCKDNLDENYGEN